MSRLHAALLTACLAAPVVGCKSDGHVPGTPSTDEVAEAWDDAGLAVTEAKPVGPRYGAGYCSTGKVSGLEVLICEFRADNELDAGRKQLEAEWQQQGLHTAVAVQAKRTLAAVMDRGKADPQGRTMSKLVTAVRGL